MKASEHFVSTLERGIIALVDKYGQDAVRATGNWQLFFAVSDAVCPGHRHNAKVAMAEDDRFADEKNELKDAHIETAIKAARQRANA